MKIVLITLVGLIAPILGSFLPKQIFEEISKLSGDSELVIPTGENVVDYEDLNTFSNVDEVVMSHLDIEWDLDFEDQLVFANVVLQMTSSIDKLAQVSLDMWNQQIHKATYTDDLRGAISLKFNIVEQEDEGEQGQQLVLSLPSYIKAGIKQGSQFNITIEYDFGTDSQALSWLTPEQTSTKTQPYLYSQCEPIYARSLIPQQDTPSIKATYNAKITAPKEINVYMSANKTDVVAANENNIHYFENQIPIPSYLMAIIAGNVEKKQVGDRTYVITEPNEIEKCVNDLKYLEDYLITVENYINITYIWGDYHIVIMPPSFPIGGMENPLLTFASPSIITGDMSGTTVAIHEIAHSWTGNMVTCGNWSSLWLNEGFTVFLERKAQQTLYGEDFMLMDSIVGNSSYMADVDYFGPTSNFTTLFPLVGHRNPDDAFSTVPYDRGFQFLYYIQSLIGDDNLQQILQGWVNANTFKSRVVEDFRNYVNEFLDLNPSVPQVQEQIDWESWVKQPGMGPIEDIEKIHFETHLETDAVDLAQSFIDLKGNSIPENWEIQKEFTPNQNYVFIEYLGQQIESVTPQILAVIEECYGFSYSHNMEIQWRWFYDSILAGYNQNKEQIYVFLGQIGRQKMITPQYKAYVATGQREYAAEIFANYYDFYHPIARITIEQILS